MNPCFLKKWIKTVKTTFYLIVYIIGKKREKDKWEFVCFRAILLTIWRRMILEKEKMNEKRD